MRLIKFRVRFNGKIVGYEWLDDGAWRWYSIDLDTRKDGSIIRIHQGIFPTGFKLEREQFTELYDQNEKDIYEKDLLKDWKGRIRKVRWDVERGGWYAPFTQEDVAYGFNDIPCANVIDKAEVLEASELSK